MVVIRGEALLPWLRPKVLPHWENLHGSLLPTRWLLGHPRLALREPLALDVSLFLLLCVALVGA
eukprot:8102801-Prorocentrum_lima.AAC.1